MENRERERAFIVRGDCEVIRPFVAKVIEQFFSFFFFFFILLSRGITSGSTSLAQSGSISVLCVRLQSTRRSNIYSNTCVVCKLVARMRIYGPLAHMHKGERIYRKTLSRSCAFDAYAGKHTIFYSFSSIKNIASTKILWIR